MSDPAAPADPIEPADLERRARALLPIVRRQARRPYIVELAGTPKAGKSTALDVLRRFLKQCGFSVQVMRERAEDCPIAMKGHFFFNTWTTTTMIASMIENLDTDADILLLDRGVFDSIVWLEDQRRAHQVSEEENEIFRRFALLERWRSRTDLTCVLTVSPERAMERENDSRLVPRTGSIVSGDFLARYNGVLADVRQQLDALFHFVDVDTTPFESTQQTNLVLASVLLENLRRWVDPEIAAIPRAAAKAIFGDARVRALPPAMEALEKALVYRPRSTLESDDGYVQLVAAATLHYDGQMLLLRRSNEHDQKRKTFGRDLLWAGCHVNRAEPSSADLLTTASMAVQTRLKEDFHLAGLDSTPIPRHLVWNENPQEVKHLGMFFDLPIPAATLAGKVFKRERNQTRVKFHSLVSPAELHARMADDPDLELESWSRDLLEHLMSADAGAER